MEIVEHLRKELRNTFKGNIPDHVLEEIIDEYLTDPHVISEIERDSAETKPEIVIYNWIGSFLMDSGPLLFDLSVERFGMPLWNGAAWQSKQCYKMCPLGDYCGRIPKKVYTIEENEYCIGQLYAGQDKKCRAKCTYSIPQLTDYELCCLTISADKLLPPGEEQLSEIEKMRVSLIFEFGPYTTKFDFKKHKYYRKTNRYPGGNVIPFL